MAVEGGAALGLRVLGPFQPSRPRKGVSRVQGASHGSGALCGHPPQPTLHPSDLRQEEPVLTPSSLPPRPLYSPDKLPDHDHEVRIQRPRLLTTNLLNVPPPGFRTGTTFQPQRQTLHSPPSSLGLTSRGLQPCQLCLQRLPFSGLHHSACSTPTPHSLLHTPRGRLSGPGSQTPHTPPTHPRIFSLQPPLPDHTTGTNIHLPRAAFPSGTCFKWTCSTSIPFP